MSKPKEEKNISTRREALLIPLEILKELLTPSEIRMLKNRWQILNLLNQGLPIREISAEVGVGTDTVVRVSKMAGERQIKLKKEEIVGKTSWIFGKSED